MSPRQRFFNLAMGVTLATACGVNAAADPNFHVYLAFGQSNMEGYANQPGDITSADKTSLPRFQVMGAVACSNLSRVKDQWSPGIAPLFRCNTGLSPVDYFARTLVDSLPTSVKIGIVPVAVAGTAIKGFMPNGVGKAYYAGLSADQAYMRNIANEYGGDPYARLVAMAKEAQKTGVIKGILFHQGETDAGPGTWSDDVKSIYNQLLADLGVKAADVPFLAGEVYNNQSKNQTIDALPKIIPTAYVISSSGLTLHTSDTQYKVHFSAQSYREFGKRYAQQMLKLLKLSSVHPSDRATAFAAGDFIVYDAKGTRMGGFNATDLASLEVGWAGASKSLPNGIYWVRNASTGYAQKVIKGI